MSVTRRHWTDDPGDGITGSILNEAELQRIYDDIDARKTVKPVSVTGTQTNYSLLHNGVDADVFYCTNSGDLTFEGVTAPAAPAKPGHCLIIMARGSGNVRLTPSVGTSGNQFVNFASSGATWLKGGSGRAVYVYDVVTANAWVMVHHDQGGFLQATFAAGNFTGNGSMTWTVASGDRPSAGTGYWLRGRQMHYAFQIGTTTVGGTLNTTLQINQAEWAGFTPASTVPFRRLAVSLDNATDVGAYCTVSGTSLTILKVNGGNWTASTDNTYVYGDLHFEVT